MGEFHKKTFLKMYKGVASKCMCLNRGTEDKTEGGVVSFLCGSRKLSNSLSYFLYELRVKTVFLWGTGRHCWVSVFQNVRKN